MVGIMGAAPKAGIEGLIGVPEQRGRKMRTQNLKRRPKGLILGDMSSLLTYPRYSLASQEAFLKKTERFIPK